MHPFSTDPGWYERHWYGLPRAGRTLRGSGQRPLPALSTLTLGLVVYFIAASVACALLASRYGWLDLVLAP